MQLLRSQLTPSDDGVKLSHKSGEPELGLANIFCSTNICWKYSLPPRRRGVNATKRGVAPLVINLLLPLLGVTSIVCWDLGADIVTNSSSSLKTFKANLLIVNLIYAHWRTRVRGETLNYVRFAFGWQQDKWLKIQFYRKSRATKSFSWYPRLKCPFYA